MNVSPCRSTQRKRYGRSSPSSPTTTPQTTTYGSGVRLTAIVLVSVGLCACGSDGPTPLGIVKGRPGVLELGTSCAADGVTAVVEETTDEVRISDVDGNEIDGDCMGSVLIELLAPLGDRVVVVNGERWVPLAPGCPLGSIGPPDLEERLDTCSPRNPDATD